MRRKNKPILLVEILEGVEDVCLGLSNPTAVVRYLSAWLNVALNI